MENYERGVRAQDGVAGVGECERLGRRSRRRNEEKREMGVVGHGLQQISRAAAAEAISAARSDC